MLSAIAYLRRTEGTDKNKLPIVEETTFLLVQVIQLYEMIVVRHGLMLVGPTGGGKSSNLHVLEETLTLLKKMGVEVCGRFRTIVLPVVVSASSRSSDDGAVLRSIAARYADCVRGA